MSTGFGFCAKYIAKSENLRMRLSDTLLSENKIFNEVRVEVCLSVKA